MIEIEFCPKCGARLILKSLSKRTLHCPKCGYASELTEGEFLKGKSSVVRTFKSDVAVLDREVLRLRTSPTVRMQCDRCGANKAETWAVTSGSEGVSSITFYRCVACGHTWRELG